MYNVSFFCCIFFWICFSSRKHFANKNLFGAQCSENQIDCFVIFNVLKPQKVVPDLQNHVYVQSIGYKVHALLDRLFFSK